MPPCAACGKTVRNDKFVWAIYGDPAFEGKPQDPFPLHEKCFERGEKVMVTEWRPIEGWQPGDPDPSMELVEFEITRYVKSAGPEWAEV